MNQKEAQRKEAFTVALTFRYFHWQVRNPRGAHVKNIGVSSCPCYSHAHIEESICITPVEGKEHKTMKSKDKKTYL